MTDDGIGQTHQAFGDTTLLHDRTGEYEQGQGQEGVGIDTLRRTLCKQGDIDVVDQKIPQTRQPNGKCNGDVQEDQRQKTGKQAECNHGSQATTGLSDCKGENRKQWM